MSFWFTKQSTQKQQCEEPDKTVILGVTNDSGDKIMDTTELCNTTNTTNTTNNTRETTDVKPIKPINLCGDSENDSDSDTESDNSENEYEKPFFHVNDKENVYALIRNRKAIGYIKTREDAINQMHNYAKKLLKSYTAGNILSEFYMRVPNNDTTLLIMAEDSFMAIIKHARIIDELKIVEIPEITPETFTAVSSPINIPIPSTGTPVSSPFGTPVNSPVGTPMQSPLGSPIGTA